MTREEAEAALDEAVATMRVALGNRTDHEWLTATTLAVQQARLLVGESGARKHENSSKPAKANGAKDVKGDYGDIG